MRLVLLRNIIGLGTVGETVEVRDGYGRNWLLPQGFGVEATPENMTQVEHRKRKLLVLEAENFQKLKAVAAEVAKQSVTIMARATEDDHLFGSVGAREIVNAFAVENLELDPRMVLLDEPIKEIGCYTVRIRLHPDIEVTSKVWVVRSDDGERPAEIPAEAAVPEETSSDEDQD
jgi:large subunit ribosomal protein L9